MDNECIWLNKYKLFNLNYSLARIEAIPQAQLADSFSYFLPCGGAHTGENLENEGLPAGVKRKAG